jgi:two-component sensor histidine kinase
VIYLCKKIDLKIRIPISVYLVLSLFACQTSKQKSNLAQFKQDSTLVSTFIRKGDSIYAQKVNFLSFSKSLDYYDSAAHIAEKNGDTGLMAVAVFAKGRAYDAINNNPKRTIEYYTNAARLYATLPQMQQKALYIKHLVAHSYDKIQDSINCIMVLNELYKEIHAQPDSIKKQLRFIPEMALISTVVKNYSLADSILQNLTKREWIKNDSTEYDYLNHYYLTKAKIDVYEKLIVNSKYVDSLEKVFVHSRNLNDSVYYSNELWELNKKLGNKNKENYYLEINNNAFNQFNPPEKVREVQEKLTKMEIASVEEKRIAETEKAALLKWSIYALVFLVIIISLLALFLQKRNREIRRKKNEVQHINEKLQQKNLQNELLNKEIHHRVKNNLQMVLSLVYLQERNSVSEETKENLHHIRLRIESIASLHRQLMEQGDVVNFKSYITNMINAVANLVGNGANILTHLEIEEINLPPNLSFPLGLIINEWITNSIKYAKTENGMLEIYMQIKNTSRFYEIKYWDSGKPVIELATRQGLGLNIIQLLSNQMQAILIQNDDNFFDYTLNILHA